MKDKGVKRIFIGIPAGDQIKSILPILKSAVDCSSSFIKWIPSENIHLTLYFLGEIPNDDVPNLIHSIEYNISISQFFLSISGTGVFPSSKSARVLWLGIEKGINELKLLHNQIGKSIREFSDNYEKNKFVPHISIAKIKQAFGKIDVLPFLNSVYSPIEIELNSISMYESKLFPEGAQYIEINTFPITD